jgi:hypothetical protein
MLRTLSPRTQDIVLNLAVAVAGLALACSPWLLDFTGTIWASWSARLLGTAIALLAVKSLIVDSDWADFATMALGIWAAISPAVLSFSHATDPAIAHLVLGGMTTSLAALKLWLQGNRPLSTT